MVKPLSEIAQEKGIRYFLISFTDLFGVQRAKLVPTAAIDSMAVNGAGFAGFATWLDMTPADPDIFAIPDPTSLFPCNHSALGIGETGIPKAEWLRKITQFLNFKP